MNKLINKPEDYVDEVLQGMAAAHPETYKIDGATGPMLRYPEPVPQKAGVVSGGGFGHIPVFAGYTLLATGLMAAGKSVKGREVVEWAEVPDLLQAAQDAMIARGGGSLGNKTMLGVMETIIAATKGIDDPEEMRGSALDAAAATLAAFKDKPNKIGPARVYAEKSIGLDDPGMMAILRLLECLDTKSA